ncbi:MAG: hypothetical protein H0W64_10145 [Gammaproteobacteria bacterium]|nr:hypothetical protein [Gammaproteobacteria bacterium]
MINFYKGLLTLLTIAGAAPALADICQSTYNEKKFSQVTIDYKQFVRCSYKDRQFYEIAGDFSPIDGPWDFYPAFKMDICSSANSKDCVYKRNK